MSVRRLSGPVLWAFCWVACAGAGAPAREQQAAASTPDLSVPISVAAGPGGSGRVPVTSGIPIPRGLLRDAKDLVLRRSSPDSEVPFQARVSERWPDGSVRWLLADWQMEPSDHRQAFVLRAGKPQTSSDEKRVRVVEDGGWVTVDTGALRFRTHRDRFEPLGDLHVEGNAAAVGSPIFEVVAGGRTLVPRTPTSVKVLEPGPLRTRIEVRGSYTDAFDYVVRIDAFAGLATIRLFHSLEQRRGPTSLSTSRVRMTLPLRGDVAAPSRPTANEVPRRFTRYRAGLLGSDGLSGDVGVTPWRLRQRDNEVFEVGGRDRRGRGAGWIDVVAADGGVSIAAPYFWQEYPQAFEARGEALLYDLLAADDAPIGMGIGSAKTHELVLTFHGPSLMSDGAMTQLAKPAIAAVDSAWVANSGALRNSVSPSGGAGPLVAAVQAAAKVVERRNAKERWDDNGDSRCQGPERARIGAFGMLNWGDWNYPGYHDDTKGCDAWGNQEYDITQVYALAFAATGDLALYDAMTVAARHFMDVDVIHAQPDHPDWVGMNHPKNPLHFSFEHGGVDLGHTWTEGLLSYYALTGDERALAAAKGVADYLERRTRAGVAFGNPRQYGWPQIALVAAFEATGEGRYSEAAKWYASRAVNIFPAGDLAHWKLGILAEAFSYVDSLAPSDDLRRWLREYAKAVAEKAPPDPRFYPAVAYVAQLDDSASLAAASRAVVARLKFGSWAKPFTIAARLGFAIEANLAAR